MSAHTRRISWSDETEVACMKPDYYGLGVVWCPVASSSSDALGMPWEFMEINIYFVGIGFSGDKKT
jgi:hypothetical protein